jgi:myo-inositol-1-phosphate synthase
MGKINVAIIGVGNCASALVQGVHYYKNAKETEFVPGLMHVNLGGYHISDINFVAAFDIDKNKVGKDWLRRFIPNQIIPSSSARCHVPASK